MNWFNGSIPDAIQRSKQQKVVFIVYVYGWCNFLNSILLIRSDVISRSGGEGGCRQNFQVSLLIYQYLIFKCYCMFNLYFEFCQLCDYAIMIDRLISKLMCAVARIDYPTTWYIRQSDLFDHQHQKVQWVEQLSRNSGALVRLLIWSVTVIISPIPLH